MWQTCAIDFSLTLHSFLAWQLLYEFYLRKALGRFHEPLLHSTYQSSYYDHFLTILRSLKNTLSESVQQHFYKPKITFMESSNAIYTWMRGEVSLMSAVSDHESIPSPMCVIPCYKPSLLLGANEWWAVSSTFIEHPQYHPHVLFLVESDWPYMVKK